MAEAVALRRVQRSIRSGDRVCLSGGMRLAVCFGAVAEGTEPHRLAARLTEAVGDRLTIGDQSIGLEVGVGVAVGSGANEPAELMDAALRSVRWRHPRPGPAPAAASDSEAVPTPPPYAGSPYTALDGSGPGSLRRRVAVGVGPRAFSPGGDPSVLVVDAVPNTSGIPGVTAHAVAACLADAGVTVSVTAPARPEVAGDGDRSGPTTPCPETVLLVVHPAPCRSQDPGASRQWEQPGVLCRSFRSAGAAVIVVSIGAAAAALAGCVENGAGGVIDIEDMPRHAAELARCAAAGELNGDSTNAARTAWARSPRFDPASLEPLMQLTPSERRVLYHLTAGSSASDISSLLVVSIATVRSHIRSILLKLDVGSQLAAVAIARGEHAGTAAR